MTHLSCMLTFMSFTLLRNVIVTQVGRLFTALTGLRLGSGGCLTGGTTTATGASTPSSSSIGINTDIYWKRIVGWCHWSRIQVTTIASDITCVASSQIQVGPTIVAASACAYSLYHNDSCLSPPYVHLVSKVSGRPLGGLYQKLSFDAAYCHTVPSLHLGNMTTVDPAMMVQPERSFEASAPSVAQLN